MKTSTKNSMLRGDRVLIDLLADKWTLNVLASLCENDYRRRFNAILRDIPDLSQKSLAQCLRRLERSGLIRRTVLTTGTLGVEYAFTELGLTLRDPIEALFKWTAQYAHDVRAAQAAFPDTATA